MVAKLFRRPSHQYMFLTLIPFGIILLLGSSITLLAPDAVQQARGWSPFISVILVLLGGSFISLGIAEWVPFRYIQLSFWLRCLTIGLNVINILLCILLFVI